MWRWISLLTLLCAMKVFAHCENPIKFAKLDWESGQFTTALLRIMLEDGYQCATQATPGTTAALETALVNGDIDVIAEQWDGRSPLMAEAESERKVQIVGNVMAGGAVQGWYIPRYLQAQYPKLQSAQDLAQFSKIFVNPDNPRQSRFLNCPSGWSCEVFNSRLLKNLGLSAAFANVHPGTGAALDAAITSAYLQQKPILFYYWQPTALMAKFDLVPLKFPAYDKACWDDLLQADGQSACVSGFPVSKLAIAVSDGFAQKNETLLDFFRHVQLPADSLNQAILQMTENKQPAEVVARRFLHEHPEVWQAWFADKNAAQRLQQALQGEGNQQEKGFFPQWSVAEPLNKQVQQWVSHYGERFHALSRVVLQHVLLPLERGLLVVPPWLWLVIVAVLAWHATRRWWFAVLCVLGLFVIGAFGLWLALMQTVALLIAAVGITVIIGVPLGILMTRGHLERLMLPVLDVMQTMPGFVYLIPVLMLFGLGKVPALFATVIYAIAPLIRLTALGIKQVPKPLIEAGTAFGSSRWQMLFWIILPQAKPSIMAGINQAVIMSLSMVVLASMIGAPGLGEPVLQAIQTQNIGQGVEAGTAIVILAMIIDRITQAYGKRGRL